MRRCTRARSGGASSSACTCCPLGRVTTSNPWGCARKGKEAWNRHHPTGTARVQGMEPGTPDIITYPMHANCCIMCCCCAFCCWHRVHATWPCPDCSPLHTRPPTPAHQPGCLSPCHPPPLPSPAAPRPRRRGAAPPPGPAPWTCAQPPSLHRRCFPPGSDKRLVGRRGRGRRVKRREGSGGGKEEAGRQWRWEGRGGKAVEAGRKRREGSGGGWVCLPMAGVRSRSCRAGY